MVRGIADQSGWICHLCRQPINPNEPKGSPWVLAGDHIIPRSQNGSDNGANIAAAHQVCNQVRHTRAIDELPPPDVFRRLAEMRVEEKDILRAHAPSTDTNVSVEPAPVSRPPREGEYIGGINATFSPWTGLPLPAGSRSFRSPTFTDPDERPFDEHTGKRRPGIEHPRSSGDYALR